MLRELPGPRLLVLGDMGEVGDRGPQFHEEAGALAGSLGIERLWCTGVLMRHAAQSFPGARHFETLEQLLEALPLVLPGVASVLVKGSRFMRMERLVQHLLASQSPSATNTVKEASCC